MSPSPVMSWATAAARGRSVAGGKGASLGRLARYGFRVPAGGVLSAEVYEAGLTALPDSVRAALALFLQDAHLAETPIAVRSSAVAEDGERASFAGIHDSVLNVRGLDAVEQAILDCYASVRTPRADAYRQRLGITADPVCAVALCEMVDATVSGVAFSGDPRSGRRDLVVIEAAPGPGDHVVRGAVTPQTIRIRYAHGRFTVESRAPADAAVLTPAQEIELARTVMRVHWALGDGQDPQDVEWVHDGERFWLLQARAVTRMPRHTFAGAAGLPIYWSNANINDAVPGVASVNTWSLIKQVIDDVLYAAPIAVGYPVPPGLETVRRFDGHAYFDFTAMQWTLYDALGVLPAETVEAIGGHFPRIPVPAGNPLLTSAGWRRLAARLRLLGRWWGFDRRFVATVARHDAELARVIPDDLAPLSRDRLHRIGLRLAALVDTLTPTVGLANMFAGIWKAPLEQLLRRIAGERAPALLSGLLAGGGALASAEQGYRIYELAQAKRRSEAEFAEALAAFLDEFGHRAVYEAEAMNPRWREDPSFILEQVDRHLEVADAESPRERAARLRRQAEAEVRRRTLVWRPLIRWLVTHLQAGLAQRERAKSAHSAIVAPSRRLMREIGARLVHAGHLDRTDDVFHLSTVDVEAYLLGQWDGAGARALADDRRARRHAWLAEAPPNVIVEGAPAEPPAAAGPAPAARGVLPGVSVSGGTAQQTARVIRHPHDGHRLGHGEVLVTPSTDPGWTPLFIRAGALVMETGGFLSHGAIVAREFGIPAVVNVPGLFDHVRDGDVVRVDGDRGEVTVVDSAG